MSKMFPVLNHSQSFHKQHVKISALCFKGFLRKVGFQNRDRDFWIPLNLPKLMQDQVSFADYCKKFSYITIYKDWIKSTCNTLSHDDGEFESCRLCGHAQIMLDELVAASGDSTLSIYCNV